MALDRAPANPRMPGAFVNRDGTLSRDGLSVLDETWRQVVAGFVTVPCQASTSSNAITLTPVLHREGGATYADHMVFAFVADATTSGAVTAGIGTLAKKKVYRNGGATQAGSGDIIANRTYLVVYNAALDTAAGGLVLIGGGFPPTATPVPIAEGGTGQITATAAFNALSPQTTRGDLITRDASNDIRLAVGAANTFLGADGTDASWRTVAQVLASLGYAVGSWTPTFSAATPPSSVTYTTQTGNYIDFVSLVFLTWRLTVNSKGSGGAGAVSIGGMPFSVTGLPVSGPIRYQTVTLPSSGVGMAGLGNGTRMDLMTFTNTTIADVTFADVANGFDTIGSMFYFK